MTGCATLCVLLSVFRFASVTSDLVYTCLQLILVMPVVGYFLKVGVHRVQEHFRIGLLFLQSCALVGKDCCKYKTKQGTN